MIQKTNSRYEILKNILLYPYNVFRICIICLCFFCFSVPSQVYADNKIATDTSNATIELTPLNVRMTLEAGATKENHITVKNVSNDQILFSVYPSPFSESDNGKTQDFVSQTNYTQLSRWVTIKNNQGKYQEKADFVLAAHDTMNIDYLIQVPKSAPDGGQYASIIVELASATNEAGSIKTISRVGTVLFASMESGETKRSVQIDNFEVPSVAIGRNVGMAFSVTNNGNIDFQASSNITVSSIFGEELYSNTVFSNVFPDQRKTIVVEWPNTSSFGVYRLDYNVTALDNNIEGVRYVIAMAPVTLVVSIFMISFLVVLITRFIKKRSHNKDHTSLAV